MSAGRGRGERRKENPTDCSGEDVLLLVRWRRRHYASVDRRLSLERMVDPSLSGGVVKGLDGKSEQLSSSRW